MPITYDTGSANTLDANSVTVTTASITTAEDNELLISFFFGADNIGASLFTAATSPTNPSDATGGDHTPFINKWGEVAEVVSTAGADTAHVFAHTVKASAGSTGTLQCTAGNASRHGLIVGAFKLPAAPSAWSPKIWDGSAWTARSASRWDGSAWQPIATAKRWDGSAWQAI